MAEHMLGTALIGAFYWCVGWCMHRAPASEARVIAPAPVWLQTLCGRPRGDGTLIPQHTFPQVVGAILLAAAIPMWVIPADDWSSGTIFLTLFTLGLGGTLTLRSWEQYVLGGGEESGE